MPSAAQGLVGVGQLGVAEDLADLRQLAVRQVERGGAADLGEPLLVVLGLAPERLVDDEPALGDPRRPAAAPASGSSVPQRFSAVSQVAGVPGTPTLSPLVYSSVRTGRGSPVAGSTKASRGIEAGAVSRPSSVVDLAAPRVVVDEVAAPADAGRVGLGHPEGGRGGDGRVDRVAPRFSTRRPALVASGSTLETAPPVPYAVGFFSV